MVLDALDRDAVVDAVGRAEPEVVVHELTALAWFTDFRKLDESFEDDPFDPDPPAGLRRTVEALRYLERAVLKTEGVQGTVLRYGGFYGPGTSAGEGGSQLEAVRRRQFPIVGAGTGVWSFIHIDDAAAATLAAIERARTGVYNIVDDDPAPVAEWLPALAAWSSRCRSATEVLPVSGPGALSLLPVLARS